MALFRMTGRQQVQARLRALAGRFPKEAGTALFQEAQIEKTESMQRTPVDTGALRASHVVSSPDISNGRIGVVISIGGPAAPYALYVHEDLEADHSVGQAKFLESTLVESAPYMPQRISRRLAALLGLS